MTDFIEPREEPYEQDLQASSYDEATPLDTDLDDDDIDSAEADERASTEGTIGDDPDISA